MSCYPLDLTAGQLGVLHELLSPDERARAARFLSSTHRNRFIAAHGRKRELLGMQLGVAPQALRFLNAAHGKPRIDDDQNPQRLEFNMSHSGDLALIGWAYGRGIGVDLELWRRLGDEAALVHRYFSRVEAAAYAALAPLERTRAFFDCWTRKEAYVKAIGRGLGLPLDSFDVSLEPGSAARLLRPSSLLSDDRDWCLADLDLGRGCSAAVVLESKQSQVLRVA